MADVLKSIAIALGAASLTVGQTTPAKATLTAETTDSRLDDDFPIAWSSSNPAVAIVNAAGVVTAVGAGNVTITGTSGTVKGSATLTVVALPTIQSDAASQAIFEALPLGAAFVIAFPTRSYPAQKQP